MTQKNGFRTSMENRKVSCCFIKRKSVAKTWGFPVIDSCYIANTKRSSVQCAGILHNIYILIALALDESIILDDAKHLSVM